MILWQTKQSLEPYSLDESEATDFKELLEKCQNSIPNITKLDKETSFDVIKEIHNILKHKYHNRPSLYISGQRHKTLDEYYYYIFERYNDTSEDNYFKKSLDYIFSSSARGEVLRESIHGFDDLLTEITYPYFIEIDVIADTYYDLLSLTSSKDISLTPVYLPSTSAQKCNKHNIEKKPNQASYYYRISDNINNGNFVFPLNMQYYDKQLHIHTVTPELLNKIVFNHSLTPWNIKDYNCSNGKYKMSVEDRFTYQRLIELYPNSITLEDFILMEHTCGINTVAALFNGITGIQGPIEQYTAAIFLTKVASEIPNVFGRHYILNSIFNSPINHCLNDRYAMPSVDYVASTLMICRYISQNPYDKIKRMFWNIFWHYFKEYSNESQIKFLREYFIKRGEDLNFHCLSTSKSTPFPNQYSGLVDSPTSFSKGKGFSTASKLFALIENFLILNMFGKSELPDEYSSKKLLDAENNTEDIKYVRSVSNDDTPFTIRLCFRGQKQRVKHRKKEYKYMKRRHSL